MNFEHGKSNSRQQVVVGTGKLFVVIPAYNEAATIEDLVRRTYPICENIIIVDDGSSDKTAEIIADLPVRVIRNARNLGKGASLMAGMREALAHGAGAVISMDGDGQHAPESIPDLVERANTAPRCIVAGSRLHDPAAIPAARYQANTIANFWISWASAHWIEDSQCGLRLYPSEVLDLICAKPRRHQGFVFESEVLIDAAAAGYRCVCVPIPALYETQNRRPSHFRPVRDIAAIVVMVAGKLFARGMYPKGLSASRRERREAESKH